MSDMNEVRREIARSHSRFARKMVGFIDSYSPSDHTAKVKYPTELDANGNPRISGWLPHDVSAGSMQGASWVIGPCIGDQCTVEHIEGDMEAGVITGYLHNTVDTPPNAPSGTAILKHNPSGNTLQFDAGGSVTTLQAGAGIINHAPTKNNFQLDQNGSVTKISAGSGIINHVPTGNNFQFDGNGLNATLAAGSAIITHTPSGNVLQFDGNGLVATIGSNVLTFNGSGLSITANGVTMTLGAAGLSLTVGGNTMEFNGTALSTSAGTITNQGHDVGSTHEHTLVTAGTANSGPPQ